MTIFPPRTAPRPGFCTRIVWTVDHPYSLAVLRAPMISMTAAPIVPRTLRTVGITFSGKTMRISTLGGTSLRNPGGGCLKMK